MIFAHSPRSAYQIAGSRHFYLDTSAIRRLGARLESWPYINESYTSVLTLIELLNGVTRDEKEFAHRHSAISGILGGGVPIDWQMPQFRLRCAFPPLRARYDILETRTECIQKLLHCLVRCRSAEEFARTEKQLALEHGLRYFNEVDEGISQRFMEAARKWVPINRQNFTDPSMPEFLSMLGLPPTASIATMAAALGGSDFDFGMGLFAVTRQFASEGQQYTEEWHDELFRSYDGTIDLYFHAMSHQIWRENGRADMPGRNAGLDLEHLLYVTEGSTIVTTDAGMARAVIDAGGITAGEALVVGGGA